VSLPLVGKDSTIKFSLLPLLLLSLRLRSRLHLLLALPAAAITSTLLRVGGVTRASPEAAAVTATTLSPADADTSAIDPSSSPAVALVAIAGIAGEMQAHAVTAASFPGLRRPLRLTVDEDANENIDALRASPLPAADRRRRCSGGGPDGGGGTLRLAVLLAMSFGAPPPLPGAIAADAAGDGMNGVCMSGGKCRGGSWHCENVRWEGGSAAEHMMFMRHNTPHHTTPHHTTPHHTTPRKQRGNTC